ncbi:sigma 54-interacting transcriptional regulator [Bhargavaea ginsengi]|uniref:sigma-54 interaction domain-containing protein n=1 Tax=Bhargavaea ginsengi TaxID=426757 RepID=UPI00203A4E1A|nr:sigma 54-interacting transcriptional regulator [Bhargavaea ginsengi]MCM3087522.1 sigma 54-interacting transcriptional regulator [Bhargavaea ginsengi]
MERVVNDWSLEVCQMKLEDNGTLTVKFEDSPPDSQKKSTNSLSLHFESDRLQEFITATDVYRSLESEFKSVMELSGELVTIVNKEGIVERVSSNCKKIMGLTVDEFVGRSIYDMERLGVITLSSSKKVLETLKEVQMTQRTRGDRRLFVRGIPLFNESGSLEKVINFSRDITEESNLQERLREREYEIGVLLKEIQRGHSEKNLLVSKAAEIEKVSYLLSKVAQTDATVLFLGETGVGKSAFAKYLHELSPRRAAPFIPLNCAVLPDQLVESELFGYAKGSFTGANQQGKKGLIEAAAGGTLFLDEIGELNLQTQTKLLQVLQEKTFTPIGKTEPVKVDVRFVTATNRDLEEMVETGTFRRDLFYRINVVPVHIPALRERVEDIPMLIHHFVDKFNGNYKRMCSISKDAIDTLINYEWPGNVRELENMMEQLIITAPSEVIQVSDLPEKVQRSKERNKMFKGSFKEQMQEHEWKILHDALQEARNLNDIAEKLKIDVSTISRKLKKHGLKLR